MQIMLMKNICKDSQAKLTNCFNFQKPTRLSVFGKKFDPADLVTRDVSSLLLSCLCSIYFGFYKVNMAGNTRFYNTRQNKTV